MSTISKTLRFPVELLDEIKPIISKRQTSFTSFVISAIESYIKSLHFTESVNKSFCSWKRNNHNELKSGSLEYVKKMRKGRKM